MAVVGNRLLSETAPQSVTRAALRIAGAAVERIESALPRALAGERQQVRAYVDAYLELTTSVLDAVREARPDLLTSDQRRRILVAVDAKCHPGARRQTVPWFQAALEQEAMSAPFSDWVGTLGAGRGSAVAMVALLRAMLPGAEPLTPPRDRRLPEWQLEGAEVIRFYRAVADELSRTETPLDHIAGVMGLTRTDLATLFGLRRQALDQWEARGVPAERQEKLATLGEIADLLAAKLKRDRIPGVVRRRASAYGGRSMLEAIEAGEENGVLDELRDAFDWAAGA